MLARRLPSTVGLLLALLFFPFPVHAQLGFESLLGGITDVSVGFSCWNTNSDFLREKACTKENIGYGVEVLWGLTSIRLGKQTVAPDTLWTVTAKEVGAGGAGDSTRHYTTRIDRSKDPRYRIAVELALGYSQFSGFASSDPSFEIHGVVRELPAIALYGSLEKDNSLLDRVAPYVGVRSGLINLHNTQFLDPVHADTTASYPGTAQAFQLGGLIGATLNPLDGVHLFGEFAYHLRRFSSVQWGGTSGMVKVPERLPEEFDFTGPSLSVGLQVHLRDPS